MLSLALITVCRADDWPQWRGPQRDGVWRETGIIEKFESAQIPIKWRAEISSGYSGPTVADGRVFVTDRVIKPEQVERVHCFDAETGKPIWTHTYACPYRDVSYDAGPRASVLVDGDRAYSLGSMGHLICSSAADGKVIWAKDCLTEYSIAMPTWGISASPIIDGDLLIVQIGGEPDATLVAFDKATGKEKWRALDDGASYSAPIIIEQAGQRVLVCYTAKRVVGVAPQTGRLLWHHPFEPTQLVIGVPSPVPYKDKLLLTNFFDGSLLLRLHSDKPEVSQVWKRAGESEKNTDALHPIIATPFIKDDHIYGVDSYGELRCLKLDTGDRVWEDLTAVPKERWANIHFVQNGETTWMFNERGELIIARLDPSGFHEISRAKLIEPTLDQLRQRGGVCWSHPAFANGHVFARNDNEIVCASLRR